MMNILKESLEALEKVIASDIENIKYYEAFCNELEKLGVDENKYDYCELFEEALIKKGLI